MLSTKSPMIHSGLYQNKIMAHLAKFDAGQHAWHCTPPSGVIKNIRVVQRQVRLTLFLSWIGSLAWNARGTDASKYASAAIVNRGDDGICRLSSLYQTSTPTRSPPQRELPNPIALALIPKPRQSRSLRLGCYLRSQGVTRVFPLSKHF